MADLVYNRFKYNLLAGVMNLANGGDTIKVALLTSSYTPDADHDVWADVSTYEVSGDGYTAGGATLANQAISQDDTDNEGVFDGDDVTWASSTITARYVVLYDDTIDGDPLMCCFDLVSDKISDNGDFEVVFGAEGIININ